MPQISVIVPVYKVEPYLHRCVDSILGQTFTDFELILVDDGSPDNCGAICDEYAEKDSRIHVIHQPNGGLSAARNTGIDWAFANSDSQWLSFIDSDDWVHPCFLDYLQKAVHEYKTDVSVCEMIRVELYFPYPEKEFHAEIMDWESFYIAGWARGAVAWNKLYRKELFAKYRYPVGRINEDEFVTYLLLEKAGKVALLDSELYYYFQNPEGIMKSSFSMKKLDALDALKEQCRFAKKRGYRRFYLSRMDGRLKKAAEYLITLNDSTEIKENEKKSIERALRSTMRSVLISEGQTIAPIKENRWYYELAFPGLAWFYWTGVGVFKRITRK